MNTHAEYRRHSHQPPSRDPDAGRPGASDAAVNPLAVHGDPSQPHATSVVAPRGKRITWVRPTELATYAAPLIGRGIDLQAELIRRARRSPLTAARAARTARASSATPTGRDAVRPSPSRRSPASRASASRASITTQQEGLHL